MKALKVLIVLVTLVGFASAMVFAQEITSTGKMKKWRGKPPAGEPFLTGKTPAQIEEAISIMPPPQMARYAKMYGLTTVKGKDVTKASMASDKERATYADRPVSASDDAWETNATIAVRPNNANIIVAAFEEEYGGYSWTTTSTDKGETWSTPKKLPPRVASDYVYTPVIRYAPNSAYLYAVYISEDYYSNLQYVMISRSTNNGSSWSAPKVVFYPTDYDGDYVADYWFRPSVDVHYFSTTTANPYLYVTCSMETSLGYFTSFFRRSKDSASTLNTTYWSTPAYYFALGAKAIGGKAGDVLWVFSAANALSTSYPFYILSVSSKDYGNTWPELTESAPLYYQTPMWLGPSAAYGYWLYSMMPSVAMMSSGTAYVAVTVDPVSGSTTPEDGDIYVMRSPRPYTTWSYPEDLTYYWWGAQGMASIRGKKTANGSVAFVAFEDHSWSSYDNELYDISVCYTGLTGGWKTARITDVSSMTSYEFNQLYMDTSVSASTTDRVVHVIWADRADKDSINDYETDVYCDVVELIY